MIQNERQYRITRAQVATFEQALQKLEASANDLHPIALQAQRDAIASQLQTFQAELDRFDALRAGEVEFEHLDVIERLPTLLIELRVAAGFTQRALGEALGIHEEQIQRYEASGYGSASLDRVLSVVACCRQRLATKSPFINIPPRPSDFLLFPN